MKPGFPYADKKKKEKKKRHSTWHDVDMTYLKKELLRKTDSSRSPLR